MDVIERAEEKLACGPMMAPMGQLTLSIDEPVPAEGMSGLKAEAALILIKAEEVLALAERNRCDPAVIEEAMENAREAWLAFMKISFLASLPAGRVRIDGDDRERDPGHDC